jgi:hypothetical protein
MNGRTLRLYWEKVKKVKKVKGVKKAIIPFFTPFNFLTFFTPQPPLKF